jgi:two-component system nitrate/nitrite response regulator NarL
MTQASELLELPRHPRLSGVRVAVVEDHALLAQSLCITLSAEGGDIHAVEITGRDDVIETCVRHRPDVVVLDLDLGVAFGDGSLLIAPLVAAGLQVLVLTGSTDESRLGACLEAGAIGVISKAEDLDFLVDRLRVAVRGGRVLPAQRRLDLMLESRRDRDERRRQLAPFEALTDRESEVLAELVDGRQVDEISRLLFVSEATVRTHVRGILLKLGVRSQLAAVARARRAGWTHAVR